MKLQVLLFRQFFFQVGESLGSIIISEKPNFFFFSSHKKNFNDVLSPPLTLLNPILEEKKSQFFFSGCISETIFFTCRQLSQNFYFPCHCFEIQSRLYIRIRPPGERVCARVWVWMCGRERARRNWWERDWERKISSKTKGDFSFSYSDNSLFLENVSIQTFLIFFPDFD